MIRETSCPSGLRVLTEAMPHVRSATHRHLARRRLGGRTGATRRGISHLLEHMVFKGTARRMRARIAEEMDAVGGKLNAATDKESTMFYAHVVDRHLPLAVDVLADMFLHSLFAAADLRKEREVVLEEIKMYDDSPDDVVGDRVRAHALARGEPRRSDDRLRAHRRRDRSRELLAWHRDRYAPGDRVGRRRREPRSRRRRRGSSPTAFAAFAGTRDAPPPERPALHRRRSTYASTIRSRRT